MRVRYTRENLLGRVDLELAKMREVGDSMSDVILQALWKHLGNDRARKALKESKWEIPEEQLAAIEAQFNQQSNAG